MSQPAAHPAPRPAPGPPVAQATAPASPTVHPADATAQHVDTPALLNRWQLIGTATVLTFGILAALVQFLAYSADGRAAADTAQLVRVQEIQSSLLRADALSTNTYLVGGLENADQRGEYDAAVDEALGLIADAADAQSADRAALAALNEQVNDYATLIAQARVNNRLGYPVGAAYQSQASDQLRTQALPILDALVEANTDRAEGAMDAHHPLWLLLIGLAALVGLWWLNRRLAQAFRRRLNRGLVLAAVLVGAVTLLVVATAWLSDGQNSDLRDGDFEAATSAAAARTAANDAKANESLRLIMRGSGGSQEDAWTAARKIVEAEVPTGSRGDWNTYVRRHQEIVAADEGNDWNRAVAIATTTKASGSTAPFDRFDERLADEVADSGAQATADLDGGRWLLLVLSVATLVAAVFAAAAVARGIGERRKEFQ